MMAGLDPRWTLTKAKPALAKAIDLANTTDSAKGVAMVGNATMQLADYAALRGYTGGMKGVYITGFLVSAAPSPIAGFFTRDDVDATSVDNGGTIIVDASGRRWKRIIDGEILAAWFGVAASSPSNDAAVAAAFAYARSTGIPLRFPEGTLAMTSASTTTWDFSSVKTKGLKIKGAGNGRTVLNFTGISSGIAMQMKADGDWFDLLVEGITFQGSLQGPVLCLGDNSFVDPLNVAEFKNVTVLNTLNHVDAVGLRLNYVVNSNFIGCRANCYANGSGTNKGTALECRQAEFNTFTNGSYSNATYGVRFKDGVSYGNVFVGTDHENLDYCVQNAQAGSGNNTFIGGTFSLWEVAAFSATGGLSTNTMTIINPNLADDDGDAVIDATNYGGIRLIDGSAVSTPAVPATTVTTTNKTGKRVLVTWWAGTITKATVDGFDIAVASGSTVVKHGQAISLTYTGSPSWLWQALE